MVKQQPHTEEVPVQPGRAIAKVKLVECRDILGKHTNRQKFRERVTYAQRHMKTLQKKAGIKRASKATSAAIYQEAVVAPTSDLMWTALRLVQRSGKSIVKAWHLQNVREWKQGLAPLDPELTAIAKIPRKWQQEYEARHA